MDALLDCPPDTPRDVRRTLNQLIDDGTLGTAIFRHQTASTNTDALGEVHHGLEQALPRLHWADRQTAGRGRQGNAWISRSKGLTFSMILPRVWSPESPLSMFVGVAVARAIEFHCAPACVGLKWPNDVYSGNGKLGGILIESSQVHVDRVVVGVGLNFDEAPSLPSSAGPPPVSISTLSPRAIDRNQLLAAVVESIVETLTDADRVDLLAAYRERCVLTGENVSLIQNGQTFTGICGGVSERGELRLRIGDQDRVFLSGEARRTRVEA